MRKLPFLLHLIIALALGLLVILGTIYLLDTYTNHAQTTEVPTVATKNLTEANRILDNKGFEVVVDSTYIDSLPKLYVIKQYPEAGQMVKTGRTIQLIVNKAAPPTVTMPGLLGVSLTNAIQYLYRSNLRLGDTLYKPDFAVGKILQQQINGVDIKPGTLVPFGTKVTLIMGSGTGGQVYNYPDFYGMTLREAYKKLDTLGLSRGAIVVDNGTKDSMSAYIYKQSPPAIDPDSKQPTVILQGNVVEFWVSAIRKPAEVDTVAIYTDSATLQEAKIEERKNQLNAAKEAKENTTTTKPKRRAPRPKKATPEAAPKPAAIKPTEEY